MLKCFHTSDVNLLIGQSHIDAVDVVGQLPNIEKLLVLNQDGMFELK